MQDSKYLKHDATASGNYKLRGYGAYWLLLETLRGMPEFKAPMSILVILAKKVRVKSLSLRRIMENYGLFVVADGHFFSPGLCKLLESYVQKTTKVSVKASVNDPRKSLKMSEISSLSAREIELKENNNSNNTVAAPVVTPVAEPVRQCITVARAPHHSHSCAASRSLVRRITVARAPHHGRSCAARVMFYESSE